MSVIGETFGDDPGIESWRHNQRSMIVNKDATLTQRLLRVAIVIAVTIVAAIVAVLATVLAVLATVLATVLTTVLAIIPICGANNIDVVPPGVIVAACDTTIAIIA